MFLKLIYIAVLCTILHKQVETAKILAAIPTASFSHQVFYQPLWKALAQRGHEVTLITTDPINDKSIKNLKEIDVSIAYDYKKNMSIKDLLESDKSMEMHKMMDIFYDTTRLVFGHKQVKQLFKDPSLQYDLLMIECIFPSTFAFVHQFNAPTICLTSLDAHFVLHAAMGNPSHHILYPNFLLPVGNPMNFIERLLTVTAMNVLTVYMDYWVYPRLSEVMDSVIQNENTVLPPADEVLHKVDMLFTNTNPLFNAVRPYTPSTVSLAGGLHETSSKPLPKDLQDFLDGASQGVVYFSLGSNVKSKDINEHTRQSIMAAFAELPQKVLWKFEADELPNKPKNVKIVKWVPQQDVLRHKNVKLFVTQAGMQSLEEALFAKVPMVALPIFGDQDVNAKRMAEKGIGLNLDHRTLTKDHFKAAVLEVINNDKYRHRVDELSSIIQDQPMKTLDRAVWWTEYVIRHKGAKHLKGPQIPVWQYYYLDVFGFIAMVISVLAFIGVKVMYYICRLVMGKVFKCKNTEKKNKFSKNRKDKNKQE